MHRPVSSADSFDVTSKKKIVDYGPSPYYPDGPYCKTLSCYFYSTFVVKEYDEGQKGADWTAIVPMVGPTPPPCSRAHDRGERVIKYPEWSGYFNGAKGKLVFVDASDGFDEGMPFAVYDSGSGKRIFEDSYHDTTLFNQKAESSPFNHMRVFEDENGQFSIKYLRVVEAGCDLPSEKYACWESVRKKLAIQSTQMPPCSRYEGITERRESAVAYPVEVTLFPKPAMKTVAGPVRCWPTD